MSGFLRRLLMVFFLLACVSLTPKAAETTEATGTTVFGDSNPFNETIQLLERWTTAHWGRDCFVWIVHYPEALIDPWVNAEALRVGMTEAERQAYRENFVSELRFGKAEPFLVTVYSFGPRPVSLAPVSKNLALVTSSGKRVKPVRYDSSLDTATPGIVQGLVFFPKQSEPDFAVAVKGMGVHDERIFAFGAAEAPLVAAVPREGKEGDENNVVVVNLPKKSNPPPRKALPPKKQEVERPHVPVAPLVHPPKPPEPLPEEESSDMALFVEQMRARKSPPKQEQEAPSEEPPKESLEDSQNVYLSRERVLRRFLDYWLANNPREMYALLSSDSQEMMAFEVFEKEVRRATDFRAALKGGYRIDWIGDDRAKVIADRRFLMIRTLATRTLGVVRESQSWKIVW
ncbi:MAG: hypothetical protein GX256_09285 [Fretibacterium sp.]|nr:hypothetical protein [Fretibacterium sp.]